MKMKPCTRCGKNTAYHCLTCKTPLCFSCSQDDPLCAACRAKIPPKRHQSDVARLLEIIDAEYQSAHQGLSGVAQGTAKHDFINARVENRERMRQRVIDLVGDEDEANKLVMEQLDKSGREPERGSE